MNFMVRRSLIFNPVIFTQIFGKSQYPDDYFWYPASHTYLEPRIPTRFCFQITNFEFQVREIPGPDNLYCGPLVKHIESTRIHTWGEFSYERSGYARRKFWTKPLKETILNFDNMNILNKTNWKKYIFLYISSRATLKEAFTAKYNGVLPRTL